MFLSLNFYFLYLPKFFNSELKMKNINLKSLVDQSSNQRLDFNIIFNNKEEHHQLPISIVNGREKGEVFTLIAGIHGYEYPPIITLQEILKEINPEQLHGTLIVLPIANLGSFYERVPRFNPDDKKNLNKTFPGSASGTITEQLADYITQNIIPLSDVFIDLHCGDSYEDLTPFACYYENPNHVENTKRAQQISEISAFPLVVSFPYNITPEEPALYAIKQAVQNGKTAISLEAGKLGILDGKNVELMKTALYNILDFSGMYHRKRQKLNTQKFFTQQNYIYAPLKGIFYSFHKSGDHIQKGENLGYITDVFGNKLAEIISPIQGTILYKISTPPVNKGETMFCIATE